MFVSPELLPADSRIWIFQSNRAFTDSEVLEIGSRAKDFINSWTAHNNELKGSYSILNNIFLVLMIDENHASASGCSIDKSVHLIRQIETDFSVSLLDRQIFAYRNGESIVLAKRSEFENAVGEGKVNDNTIVFNNMVERKNELFSKWEIPFNQSWHKSLFQVAR